jgi:hypothetical protein
MPCTTCAETVISGCFFRSLGDDLHRRGHRNRSLPRYRQRLEERWTSGSAARLRSYGYVLQPQELGPRRSTKGANLNLCCAFSRFRLLLGHDLSRKHDQLPPYSRWSYQGEPRLFASTSVTSGGGIAYDTCSICSSPIVLLTPLSDLLSDGTSTPIDHLAWSHRFFTDHDARPFRIVAGTTGLLSCPLNWPPRPFSSTTGSSLPK